MARRVFVTGMGCLSGLAQGVEQTWQALIDGRDATQPFRQQLGDAPHLIVEGVAVPMQPPDLSAFGARYKSQALAQMDPFASHAVLAAFEALDNAGLLDEPEMLRRAGTLFGNSSGGLSSMEHSYQRLFQLQSKSMHPMTIPRQMTSAAASQISMIFGMQGPSFGIASACASSAHAIAEATEMIRAGRAEVLVAGGAEAPLTVGSWIAWRGLRVIARERCRPFSAGRDGTVLGEGAAAVVLESEDHARARGATPLAEILGAGASADATHMTQPSRIGAIAAITAALKQAKLPPGHPLLISSHGTATVMNDLSEAAALREVFGAGLDKSLVVATKSAHGHLCGGSGAIEFVVGLLALRHGLAPPVMHYLGPDPECDLPLALGAPARIDYDILLANSFGFGGLNSVLVARAM